MTVVVGIGRIRREPDTAGLDARDLDWLLERFLLDRRGVIDGATVDGYAFKLAWFRAWWQQVGPGCDWILTRETLLAFERYLRGVTSPRTGRPLAYHTRKDVLRRLREALRWAQAVGYLDRSYAAWVPPAQGGAPVRRAARVEALWRLMEAAAQSPYPARDRTILALMIGMGLRRGEVAALNVEDLVVEADQSGEATVHGKRTKANPTGIRLAAFDAATGRYVVAYLDACGYAAGPLFRAPGGSRLTPVGVYKAVKRAIRLAGLQDSIQGCHDLRRAFATHWAREHKGERAADLLRRQLGHASFQMTTHYLLTEVDDIREEIVSPLAFAPMR